MCAGIDMGVHVYVGTHVCTHVKARGKPGGIIHSLF